MFVGSVGFDVVWLLFFCVFFGSKDGVVFFLGFFVIV